MGASKSMSQRLPCSWWPQVNGPGLSLNTGIKGQGWVRGKVCALRNWRSQRGEPGVQVLSQGVIAPFLPEGGQMVARSTPKASVEHKMTREGTSLHGTPEGCS